jgi:putative endonuclease
MTNRVRGVLYTGVTSDLAARVAQHRAGKGSAFCRKYKLKRLVLAEHHDTIDDAIRREKMLKAWSRVWKIELIEKIESFLARPVGRGDRRLREMRFQLSLE